MASQGLLLLLLVSTSWSVVTSSSSSPFLEVEEGVYSGITVRVSDSVPRQHCRRALNNIEVGIHVSNFLRRNSDIVRNDDHLGSRIILLTKGKRFVCNMGRFLSLCTRYNESALKVRWKTTTTSKASSSFQSLKDH